MVFVKINCLSRKKVEIMLPIDKAGLLSWAKFALITKPYRHLSREIYHFEHSAIESYLSKRDLLYRRVIQTGKFLQNKLYAVTCWAYRLFKPFALSSGSFSQFNIIHLPGQPVQPGANACAYVAAQAVLQMLQGELETPEEIDLAVARGVKSALCDYGLVATQNIDSEGEVSEIISKLTAELIENNPDGHIQDVLEQVADQDWEGISSRYRQLCAIVDYSDPDRLRDLCCCQADREQLLAKLHIFATLSEEPKSAALLTIPHYTFAVFILKDEHGRIDEVRFFDPHGQSKAMRSTFLIMPDATFQLIWKKSLRTPRPLERAVELIDRVYTVNRFTITPLKLVEEADGNSSSH